MSTLSRAMQTAASGLAGNEWTFNDVTKAYEGLPVSIFPSNGGQDMFISRDGLHLVWAACSTGTSSAPVTSNNFTLYHINLASAYDTSYIDESSYTSSLALTSTQYMSFTMSDDGLNLYIIQDAADTVIAQYVLSTAWDLSTAVFSTSIPLYPGSALNRYSDLRFDSTGTRLAISHRSVFIRSLQTYTLSSAWDISTATLDADKYLNEFGLAYSVPGRSFSVNAGLYDFFWKPDGLRFYVIDQDSSGTTIHQWDCDTSFDVSTARYAGAKFISSTQFRCVHFKTDGRRLYVTQGSTVREYSLSTAWDVTSTLSFVTSETVEGSGTVQRSIYFKPDGLRMYVTGDDSLGGELEGVLQYNLSSAWNVNTATLAARLDLSSSDIYYIEFDDSGNLYWSTTTTSNRTVLNTAWDLSSGVASTASNSTEFDFGFALRYTGGAVTGIDGRYSAISVDRFALGTPDNIATMSADDPTTGTYSFFTGEFQKGLDVNSAGTAFYVGTYSSGTNKLIKVPLSSSWDLDTAGTEQVSPELFAAEVAGSGDSIPPITQVIVPSSGEEAIVFTQTNNRLTKFTLGTAEDVTTATFDSSNSKGIYYPIDTVDFFRISRDGNWAVTKQFYGGLTRYVTYEFGYPFDLTTLSLYSAASFSSASFLDGKYSEDGTKLYFAGGDDILQYDLSTAFDISSATLAYREPVIGFINIVSFAFSPDGRKLIMTSPAEEDMYYTELSTPWDVRTHGTVNVTIPPVAVRGGIITLNTTGTILAIQSQSTQTIYIYRLSTAFDPSTATYNTEFYTLDENIDLPTLGENSTTGDGSITSTWRPDGKSFYATSKKAGYVLEYKTEL